jgi:hypothetical protein
VFDWLRVVLVNFFGKHRIDNGTVRNSPAAAVDTENADGRARQADGDVQILNYDANEAENASHRGIVSARERLAALLRASRALVRAPAVGHWGGGRKNGESGDDGEGELGEHRAEAEGFK